MDESAKEIGKTKAMYIVAVIAVIAIVTGISSLRPAESDDSLGMTSNPHSSL